MSAPAWRNYSGADWSRPVGFVLPLKPLESTVANSTDTQWEAPPARCSNASGSTCCPAIRP